MNDEAAVVAAEAGDPIAERKRLSEARRLRRLRILFPFLLVVVLIVYTFTTNFIPSESMLPNLQPGDHTLTMRAWIAYPFGRMPARGDIIVFNLPKDQAAKDPNVPAGGDQVVGRQQIGVFRKPPGDVLIKRVVGLPGDSIRIRFGKVYINDREYQPSYKTLPANPTSDGEYRYCVDAPLKLGPDEMLVLGDNGTNSDDGRYWGPLKRSNVIGKYIRVLFKESRRGPNEKLEETARSQQNAPAGAPTNP